jgi:hypothetical protein
MAITETGIKSMNYIDFLRCTTRTTSLKQSNNKIILTIENNVNKLDYELQGNAHTKCKNWQEQHLFATT